MSVDIKQIIEQMARQELKNVLAEAVHSIREMVKTSLLPELRAAIRNAITEAIEDILQESPPTPESIPLYENVTFKEPGFDSVSEFDLQSCQTNTLESDNLGRYLYCIVEGSERVNFGNIGIEKNEVYTVPYEDICGVVHDCCPEPYRSEDEDVIKSWVLTHQKTIDAAWEKFGTVLPIAFDTIISGNGDCDPEENMKNWLKEEYGNLKSKIKKVKGEAEYGVQIFWNPKLVAQKLTEESSEIKTLNEEIKTKPKGLAYMYRQKLEDTMREAMEKEADRYFREFYEKIKPLVDDIQIEKTKQAESEDKKMLMNLSCLLPKENSYILGDELERIDTMNEFSVRYTGPWPPFNFV
ncbi:MAG: GvpL/GvpF family gas vesicle protein [Thermodesulfobacteriota bacterium]|nr:GvpL/GvpF family gas vesicle protein [Thermodesulfobacteriota bacterium]